MTEELERRTVAYLRHVVDACKSCTRTAYCSDCERGWAKVILRDIDISRGPVQEIDYSLEERVRRINEILAKADRPLTFGEIDIRDLCSRQLKYWTICGLVRTKRIIRKKINGRYHFELNREYTNK